MLTDQESAVTARDVTTGAVGILGHGEGSALILDRVPKQRRILENDTIVTAGRGQGRLGSFFPRNIPIGSVEFVGQTDVDLYQDVQVRPFVDFSDLDSVLVLVPKNR
jgi:rod shape-determining protein MreC